MEKLYIHFKNDNHYLTVDEFIKTVNSSKVIFENIKNDILELDIDAEIVVYAPEKGSLLLTIGAIAGGTVWFLETDLGKKFVKGLTGNEPSYYSEKAGLLIRDLLKAIYSKSQNEIRQIIDELKEVYPQILKLDKSTKAKSDFYNICLSNKDIEGVGFDKSEEFPIKRSDFWNHVSGDNISPLPSENFYQELIIVKPVTIESNAKWCLKDTGTGKVADYSILDEDFKKRILCGDNPLKKTKQDDRIIAKVKYVKELKNGIERNAEINVLEVYRFNNEEFKRIPKDFELNKKIKEEIVIGQQSLFKDIQKNELLAQ